jgi:Protein of unknown function (DUF3574)
VTRRSAAALLLVVLAAPGCAAAPPAGRAFEPATSAPGYVRSELIFGRLRPGGALVTDGEWHAFVAEHVTPRFPDGFTVLDATGQYRDRTGRIVAEPTKILLIVHAPEPRIRAALQELRDVYRQLFDQDSVLLITGPTQMPF